MKILGKFEMRDGFVVIYLYGYIIFWFFLFVIVLIMLVVDKNIININLLMILVIYIIKGNEINMIDMFLLLFIYNIDNIDIKMNVRYLFLIIIFFCSVWNVMRLCVNYEYKVLYLYYINILVLIYYLFKGICELWYCLYLYVLW